MVVISISEQIKDLAISDGLPSCTSISEQIEDLAVSHGLPCSPSKLLQPRHSLEFPSDSLFHRYARAVCRANKIPRKELFEAWGMALYVHEYFPKTRRLADLACGHGLVSWALLLLFSTTDGRTPNNGVVVSAVCIDIKMPLAAERLQKVMLDEWPQFKDCWDYVEGSMDGIIPAPSTLLVGVHACSQLSDKVISYAIYGNAPLALVPCCHSKKCLPGRAQKEQRKLALDTFANLTEYIDYYRIEQLEDAGMIVQEAKISVSITPKNRIILAEPSSSSSSPPPTTRLNPSPILSTMSIPLDDTPESRETIRSLAGRAAAEQRVVSNTPSYGIVVYLPPNEDVYIEQIAEVARTVSKTDVDVKSSGSTERHHDEAAGRYSRTFRIVYKDVACKQRGKNLHIKVCHEVSNFIPGASVRKIPIAHQSIDLEVYMPDSGDVSTEDITKIVNTITITDITTTDITTTTTVDTTVKSDSMNAKNIKVRMINKKPFIDRANGRYVRFFRIKYIDQTPQQAKMFHAAISRKVPDAIPGASVFLDRQKQQY